MWLRESESIAMPFSVTPWCFSRIHKEVNDACNTLILINTSTSHIQTRQSEFTNPGQLNRIRARRIQIEWILQVIPRTLPLKVQTAEWVKWRERDRRKENLLFCTNIRPSICLSKIRESHTIAFLPFHPLKVYSVAGCFFFAFVKPFRYLAIRFALINILFARRKIMKMCDDFNDFCLPVV